MTADGIGATTAGEMRERRDSFFVWRQATAEAEAALQQLLPDPDRILDAGKELSSPWRSEATDKVRVEIGGRAYFLKRYNRTGSLYSLKNAFRPSRALRSWRAVQRFARCGVPTPVPLLCLEERHRRLLGRSYLLFPFVAAEAGSFLDLWPRLDSDVQRHCLEGLARVLGRMHRQGLLHGDLNWRNILAAREGEGFRFWLVDLDGSRRISRFSAGRAEKDLSHFLRDLQRSGAAPELRTAFLDRWRRAAGFALS
jgi:tRNA A-37 threonylcarbamoyl transferase component Bud32